MVRHCPLRMGHHYACAMSASLATKWRNTSCASSWPTILPRSVTARAAIGKIRATSGGRGFDGQVPGRRQASCKGAADPAPILYGVFLAGHDLHGDLAIAGLG